jgi:hypothetical protein
VALCPEARRVVLELMQRGASPAGACQQVGLTVDAFWTTLEREPTFAEALERVFDSLSHNVLAALYQNAMKGHVTAQQFWLRNRPATLFQADHADDSSELTARLTDDQLVDECRAAGVALPARVAARHAATGGGGPSGGPSPGAAAEA